MITPSLGTITLLVASAFAQQTAPATPGWFEIPVTPEAERPSEDEANIAAGKLTYNFRCAPCHGVEGDATGPVAQYLDPRPRDFTQANFKFRTTEFSELPLDEDLFRTITRGIPGTAMPSWAPLSVEERWQLIYYVKTFSDFFEDEFFDPRREEDGKTFLLDIPEPPPVTEELVARGAEVFHSGKCIECHGMEGRGDGTSAGKQKTYLEHRILPRQLSKGWRYKGGTGLRDIFRTLTGGLNGTPMPSFISSLDEHDELNDVADRWAVAAWVKSQIDEVDHSEETLLIVRKVDQIPTDPDDPAWDTANEIHFRLIGQVTRRPRWQTPAVDHVRVRALFDDDEIAIRLEYLDRTLSTEHEDPDILTEETTYPVLDVSEYAWNTTSYPDGSAIQFPAKKPEGAKRPYFIYGQVDKPVVLWKFSADLPEGSQLQQLSAKGPDKIKLVEEPTAPLSGEGRFEDGRWRVVMTRSLFTDDTKDVQFTPDEYIPFVVMGWDGGNGESGLRQSISSWYNMQLEAPIPARAYGIGFLAFLLVGVFELRLFFRANRGRK